MKSAAGSTTPCASSAWLQEAIREAEEASVVVDGHLAADRDFDCRLAVAAQLTGRLRAKVAAELSYTVSAGARPLMQQIHHCFCTRMIVRCTYVRCSG